MIRTPRQNRLLAALPAETYERLAPHLELVALPRGTAIYEPGMAPEYACFPTSCIVSVLSPMEDGAAPEVAVIGNDGLVGIALLMGGAATTNTRAVVQSAGHGYRIRAHVLQAAAEDDMPLRHLMLRYAQSLMTQMSQSAACNRLRHLPPRSRPSELAHGAATAIHPTTRRLTIPSSCRRSVRCPPPRRRGYGGRRRPDDSAAHRACRASAEHCRC